MQAVVQRFQMGFVASAVMTIWLATAPALANGGLMGVCTVDTTPIAFGKYDAIAHADLASVAMLNYRCVGNVKRLAIGLSAGRAGSLQRRSMRQGRHQLEYNLYLDGANTQVWGDGTRGSQMYIVNSPPSGNYVSLPVYGRIFDGQNSPAGSYQDEVSIIVRY